MDIYEAIVSLRREGREGALVTLVARSGSSPMPDRAKMLVRDDGSTVGTVGGGAMEARLVKEAQDAMRSDRAFTTAFELTAASDPELGMICGGRAEFLVEPVSPPPEVLIVGAGHVGRALAVALAPLDVGLAVLDDRPESLTRERIPRGRLIPAASMADGFAEAQPGRRTFVVVTARSHDLELDAVRLALATPVPFVGVLGSRRKAAAMRARLEGEGVTGLDRIQSPVGLPIGAEDPAEIALSIAAELVARRRGATSRAPRPEAPALTEA